MKIIDLNPSNHKCLKDVKIGEIFKPNTNEDYYFLKIDSLSVDGISPNNVFKVNAIIVGKTDRGSAKYIGGVEAFSDNTVVTTYPHAYICLGNA